MQIEEEQPHRLVLTDPRRPIAASVLFAIAALWFLFVTPSAYQQNGLLTALVAAAGTALPLIWGILLLRRCNVILDGERGVAVVSRSMSPYAKRWTIPFDEISELYLHRSSDPEGGPGYQPFIGTKQGTVQCTLTVYDQKTADAALDAAARFLSAAGVTVKRCEKPKTWHGWKDRPADA